MSSENTTSTATNETGRGETEDLSDAARPSPGGRRPRSPRRSSPRRAGTSCTCSTGSIAAASAGSRPRHERGHGREMLAAALDTRRRRRPEQIQCFAVPGHKADFGVMMAGPDLKAIHGVQMAIQASPLGPALMPTYSFYSITEVSEYVPDVEEYGRILRDREGVDPESSVYKTKVAALRRAARADEPAAALSRIPRLALPLLLPDEQDAPGGPELVPAPLRGRGPS